MPRNRQCSAEHYDSMASTIQTPCHLLDHNDTICDVVQDARRTFASRYPSSSSPAQELRLLEKPARSSRNSKLHHLYLSFGELECCRHDVFTYQCFKGTEGKGIYGLLIRL